MIKLLLLFIISANTIVFAGNPKADSLINLIPQTTKKTSLINLYLDISKGIRLENKDSACFYDKSALNLAIELNDTLSQLKAIYRIAKYYNYKAEYKKSIDYYNNGLNLATKINHKSIINYNNGIGNLYFLLGKYNKAIKYYEQALKKNEENKDTFNIAESYFNIANVNTQQGNYNKSIKYCNRAIILLENNDNYKELKADTYHNLGNVLSYNGENVQAIENYLVSLKYYEEIGDTKKIAYCNYDIGFVQSELENFDKAEYYFNKVWLSSSLHSNFIISIFESWKQRIKSKSYIGH